MRRLSATLFRGGWPATRVRVLGRMPLLILLTIVGGLLLDQLGGRLGPPLVNVWVWSLYALLLLVEKPAMRSPLIVCLAIATAGELFLSLLWRLYLYRDGGLPLFVPPGHVLLFWLGMHSVARVPYRLLALVPWLAVPPAIWMAWQGHDHLGLVLCAFFLLCWRFGPAPRLYAWMFLLALWMELFATWLGNWQWQTHDPWFGLAMTNPPLAAGAFYCVLDLMVLLWARWRGRGGV